jgi:N-methylhydantoinase A
MGGTTAKVGMLHDGKPTRVSEFEIGVSANRWRGWHAGAAGYPILTPAVDMIEVGTGGGSVAWVDDGGKLRVGPKSAGAAPGPVCYGQGGTMPTVTDADLVLGRIDPDYFVGGEMRLDVPASHRAIAALSERIDLTPEATAAGIVQIADAAMAQALRVVSVQRGYDPTTFKLVPFGGAGPLHALAIAADTGITAVLVPPQPGVASALGLLVADLKHDNARTIAQRLADVTEDQLAAIFRELEAKGREPLVREGVPDSAMCFEWSFDLRYVGQSYHLNIALARGALDATVIEKARRRFDSAHEATYGYAEPDEPCELVNVRVSAIGAIPTPKLEEAAFRSAESGRRATRCVWFQQTGFTECAIYERAGLLQGEQIEGPAVIEDRDATTLVHPGWRCSVERFGVLSVWRTD